MRDVDYAMPVARIRINETHLLSAQDIDRMITAKSVSEILSVLSEKGYEIDRGISEAFAARIETAWNLVREIAPDFSEFNFLLVKNDFHNFKAVLKGIVTEKDYHAFCMSPYTIPPDQMAAAIREQRFSVLPGYMSARAGQAYEAFVHTADGQLSDTILDRGALDAIVSMSSMLQNEFLRQLGEWMAATANMRIAVRGAKTGKSSALLEEALCSCKTLYKKELISAAASGLDALCEYFIKTGYKNAAEALKQSVGAFEKWSDNAVVEFVRKAKYDSFGPAPLAAYLIKSEAEVKTVRILLSAKTAGHSDGEIRTRIRLTD